MIRIVGLVLGAVAGALATLFALGCFDPPAAAAPIKVQARNCQAEMMQCGSGHKCWVDFHECIGAGAIDESI